MDKVIFHFAASSCSLLALVIGGAFYWYLVEWNSDFFPHPILGQCIFDSVWRHKAQGSVASEINATFKPPQKCYYKSCITSCSTFKNCANYYREVVFNDNNPAYYTFSDIDNWIFIIQVSRVCFAIYIKVTVRCHPRHFETLSVFNKLYYLALSSGPLSVYKKKHHWLIMILTKISTPMAVSNLKIIFKCTKKAKKVKWRPQKGQKM